MKTVREILSTKGHLVHSIAPSASMFDALRLMAHHDIGALLVRSGGGAIDGLLSERDYSRKVILKGKSSHDLPVSEVMSTVVHTVTPKDTLKACMGMMIRERTRHLPVLDRAELVGLISMGDVVRGVIEAQQLEIEQLEGYIMGRPG